MGNIKAPDRVFDAIYHAKRELFLNRALSQPFTKTEIFTLYRRTIELLAARTPRVNRRAKPGDEVFAHAVGMSIKASS